MKLESLNNLINEISIEYNYSSELVDALKRCIPEMIRGKSEQDISLLINTLKRVQIFTFENVPTQEMIDNITNEKLNGRNKDINIIGADLGEYNKMVAPGAYVSQPVFDDNMNITERVGFIYLTNLSEYNILNTTYGTHINLSHLIHELGHAWVAQKGEYEQEEGGDYVHNVGTMKTSYKVNRETKTVEEKETQGLYLEEALNTIEEENVLYKVLGVEHYRNIPGYVGSNYQGCMSDMTRYYIEKIGSDKFYELRFQKNNVRIKQEQEYFDETDFMKHLIEEEYERDKRSKLYSYENTDMSEKSKIRLKSFFEEYEDIYFAKRRHQDYIRHLDGVLEQIFNFMTVKLAFDITNSEQKSAYSNILTEILREGYVPVNQAMQIKQEKGAEEKISMQELTKQALSTNVTITEVENASNQKMRQLKEKGEIDVGEQNI